MFPPPEVMRSLPQSIEASDQPAPARDLPVLLAAAAEHPALCAPAAVPVDTSMGQCTIWWFGHCVWVMAAFDGHDFDEFFRSELRSVVSTVYGITGDVGLSEEITQDAFVRALTRWRRLRRYDRPGAWVRRVAIRDAIRAVERIARQEPVARIEGPVAAPLPSKDEALAAAVGALPPQQRAAVALYYLEGRPTAEVADLLACSAATVRSHLHRARQQLAAVLGDERQEEVGDVRG